MIGILIVTSIALVLSVFLVLVNFFLNKIDKRVEEVVALLPGYNCGACGFPGCQGLANQIIHNGVDPKRCKPIKVEQYNNLIDYLKTLDNKE